MRLINHALSQIPGEMIMDVNEDNEYELELEKAKKEYLIAADFLKGYFKFIYENANKEWTDKDDAAIEKVMCAIKNLAYWESVKATRIMTKREKRTIKEQ
jgi:hypothetical protein